MGKLIGGVVVVAVALLAIYVGMNSFTFVPNGEVGVLSSFGRLDKGTLPQGPNSKAFWKGVYMVNTQYQPFQDKAEGSSKDLQLVSTEITVQYSLVGPMAPEMLKNIGVDVHGDIEPNILGPAVQESVKQVTALYSAEQLITQFPKVKAGIEDAIKAFVATTLKSKGVIGGIDISNVAVTNFTFSKEFDAAIESKVKSAQQVQQARNTAQQTVTEAQAWAGKTKAEADSEAFQVTAKAKADAKAITLEGDQLRKNPELLNLRLTQKWNGHLPPTYMGGKNTLPFLGPSLQVQK